MKKRNILTIALALVLTVVLSVGATLAYLTDTDTQVVNTFKFANNMTVELWEEEPVPVKDEKIVSGDKDIGWNYENVVVGQMLNKEPELATTTSVDAFVFVKVEGFNADNMVTKVDTSDWKVIPDTTDGTGNGVYYKVVDGKGERQPLGSIFEQVEVKSTATNLADITIKVYEIQQTGFTGEGITEEAAAVAAHAQVDWTSAPAAGGTT